MDLGFDWDMFAPTLASLLIAVGAIGYFLRFSDVATQALAMLAFIVTIFLAMGGSMDQIGNIFDNILGGDW